MEVDVGTSGVGDDVGMDVDSACSATEELVSSALGAGIGDDISSDGISSDGASSDGVSSDGNGEGFAGGMTRIGFRISETVPTVSEISVANAPVNKKTDTIKHNGSAIMLSFRLPRR